MRSGNDGIPYKIGFSQGCILQVFLLFRQQQCLLLVLHGKVFLFEVFFLLGDLYFLQFLRTGEEIDLGLPLLRQ